MRRRAVAYGFGKQQPDLIGYGQRERLIINTSSIVVSDLNFAEDSTLVVPAAVEICPAAFNGRIWPTAG